MAKSLWDGLVDEKHLPSQIVGTVAARAAKGTALEKPVETARRVAADATTKFTGYLAKTVGLGIDALSPDASPGARQDVVSRAARRAEDVARGTVGSLGDGIQYLNDSGMLGSVKQLGADMRAQRDAHDAERAQAIAAENAARAAAGRPSLEQENEANAFNTLGAGLIDVGDRMGRNISEQRRASQDAMGQAIGKGAREAVRFAAENPLDTAQNIGPEMAALMLPGIGIGRAAGGVARAAGADAVAASRIARTAGVASEVGSTTLGNTADVKTQLDNMDDASLQKLPLYAELARAGLDPAAIRAEITRRAVDSSLGTDALFNAVTIGLPAAAGFRSAEEALIAGRAAASGSRAANALKVGGIEAAQEYVQEGGDQISQNMAEVASSQKGVDQLGDNVPGAAALGAAAGGPVGIASGAMESKATDPNDASAPAQQRPTGPIVINPARGPISRALAAGAAAGAVDATIHVEQDFALGAPGDYGDLVQAPGMPAPMVPPPGNTATSNAIPQLNAQTLSAPFTPVPTGYAADAGPKMEGETPKSYLKRVIDRLPPPTREQLPTDPGAYFTLPKADAIVPLSQLLPSKGAQPEASANATKRMAAAAAGVIDRRDPIDVRANADGTYTVLDGNGSLGAALQVGLSAMPVRIKEAEAGREGWRNDRGYHPPEVAEALTRTYETAAAEKPLFDQTNASIAKELGLSAPAVVDLKGRTRAEEKLLGYNGDVRKLSDLARTTFEVDSVDDVAPLLQRLQAAYPNAPENWKLKHFLDPAADTPYAGGYRDSKMVATLPNGTRAEIQINLKPMLEAKKAAHVFYEDFRKLDERIVNENRDPTPEEQAQLDALDAQMREVYAPAWAAVLSASKTAGSIGTPSSATDVLRNTLPAGTSNARTISTPDSSRQIATGTPLTSKNFVPSGNASTGIAPENGVGFNTDNTNTSAPEALGAPMPAGWNLRRPDGNGLIVSGKPGERILVRYSERVPANKSGTKTKLVERVKLDDKGNPVTRPYSRDREDGGYLPPFAAPVQYDADVAALHKATAQILKRPPAAKLLRTAFGVKGLKLTPIRGSFDGNPEQSYRIDAEGMTFEQARDVAKFLGMAFSQDAVIAVKPDPVGQEADSIPTIELHSTNGAKLSDSVFDAVTAELRAQGLDYSEAREGRAIRVLHFGDEAGLEQLATIMAAAAQAHGLEINHLHTRSELYEAQDYRRDLGQGGDQAVQGFGPEVFRGLVDHLVVPHVRAAESVGYRFDADRYAERFGLNDAEAAYLKSRLADRGPRDTVDLLRDGAPALQGTGKKGNVVNSDAARFLQDRAAAKGVIKPGDFSPEARAQIAESMTAEVMYQLNKPEGKQALGWYERQLPEALRIISEVFPELADNDGARFMFKAALAVTSQGVDVKLNFATAMKVYEKFKASGKIDPSAVTIPGKGGKAARENLAKLRTMIEARGVDGAAAFMRAEHTVRDLRKAGFKLPGYAIDDELKGWAVFGPKIGSFGNNLDGDFKTLTADLWFSRTWNRMLGSMFKYSAKNEAEHIRSFREELAKALAKPGSNAIVDYMSGAERAAVEAGDLDAQLELAGRIAAAFAKGNFKDKTQLNRAGKNWSENVAHLQDAPRGMPERKFQREVIADVQARVRDAIGQDVTVADLQALLWYQEKELFRILGASNERSAPLDYVDGANQAVKEWRESQAQNDYVGRDYEPAGEYGPANALVMQLKYPMGLEALAAKVRAAIGNRAQVRVLAGDGKSATRVLITGIGDEVTESKYDLYDSGFSTSTIYATQHDPSVDDVEPIKAPIDARFKVPPQVLSAGKVRSLEPHERAKVGEALESLRTKGYPESWLNRAMYFSAHDASSWMAGAFYFDGAMAGSISFNSDIVQTGSARELEFIIAHELAHAADYSTAFEGFGFASLSSPLFRTTTTNGGVPSYDGEIIAEMYEFYRTRANSAANRLKYPFARGDFGADTMATEAFAMAVELYSTFREQLKAGAPKTHAFVEEMFRAAKAAPDRSDGGSAPGVQVALRSAGGRRIGAAIQRAAADADGRAVDRQERDRPEAGRAGQRRDGDAQSVTDTPAFKRWFGDSKVVDYDGNPKVVYHGTLAQAFDTFSRATGGYATQAKSINAIGSWFTDSTEDASMYAGNGKAEGGHVLPVYLSLQNPFRVQSLDGLTGMWQAFGGGDARLQNGDPERMKRELQDAGYDGIVVEAQVLDRFATEGSQYYVAFEPTQIKSATANSGKFDPANPSILGSPGAPASAFDGWTMPSWQLGQHLSQQAGSRLSQYQSAAKAGGEKLRTMLQDYFLPVRRVQEAIEKTGGTVTEDTDVYGREELYYGRTGEQLRVIEDEHVKPLVQAMTDAKVDLADLELYLYANFAPARNARIAAINPAMPDGGSGMTNADAAKVIADFHSAGKSAALAALAARVRALNTLRIDTLEAGGLLTPEQAADWRAEPNYVPLKGLAEGLEPPEGGTRNATGQGFSIGGREAHRALGRKSRASDLLANTIAQVEQAVIRAEKNRVATALLRLAEANPNDALWTVDKIPKKRMLSPSGEVVERADNLHKLADNVVSAKVNGVEHLITLKDQRVANAVKNMGAAKMGAFLRGFAAVNRMLSLTRTMLAPEFVLANFARDLQTASVNLTGDQSAAMAARVIKDVPVSIRAMYAQLRGKSRGGEWARWAQEFADAGGMTNFVAQRTVEEQQAKINGLLKDAKGGTRVAIKRMLVGTLDLIEDVNGAVENATRLAAYANARRQGMSTQVAARLAKNLTVNFNRKGEVGPVINALYLFYNASIQGTVRFARAMKSPKVQGIMAATAALGFGLASMNRAAGGEDDDGEDRWDKVPDYEKARNLIIMLPGTEGEMVKIPLPYTYNLPFLIGSETESMLKSKRPASSAAANIAEAMLTSFSPIGDLDLKGDSAVAAAKLLSPTATDPLVDIATNTNFFGAPISPAANPFDKTPEPDSERFFASTNPAARWLARTLNSATGGNAAKPGLIDVSPASMVYLFDYLTGGTGSFVDRAVTAATLKAQGEPVPDRTIPFWRTFKGELSERRVTDTFYTARADVEQKAAQFELGRKGGFDSPEEARQARQGWQLAKRLKVAERQLSVIRKRRKAAQLEGDKASVKRFEERERAIQLRFNTAYFRALDEESGAD